MPRGQVCRRRRFDHLHRLPRGQVLCFNAIPRFTRGGSFGVHRLRGRQVLGFDRADELRCLHQLRRRQILEWARMSQRLEYPGIDMLSLLHYEFGLADCSPALRRPRWRLSFPRQPSAAKPLAKPYIWLWVSMDWRKRQGDRGVVEDSRWAADFVFKMVRRRTK